MCCLPCGHVAEHGGRERARRVDQGAQETGIDAIVAYGGAVDIGMRSFVATGIETIDASAATGPVRILGDGGANILDFSATVFIGKIVIDVSDER